MGKMKLFGAFLVGGITFVACGTMGDVKFPYEFYHVSPIQTWQYSGGQLFGAKGERKPLTSCAPVKNAQGDYVQKCVVVFYSELNKLVADYKKTKQALIDCEKGK